MRGFDNHKLFNPKSGIDPTPSAAKAYLWSTIKDGLERHFRSTERWALKPHEVRVEADLLGVHSFLRKPQNALAANMGLRWQIGATGVDAFSEFAASRPGVRFALVTLISDRWLTYDCDTYLHLGAMKAASQVVLDRANLDGWFACAEVQTLDESVRGLGRILLPHVHAIIWTSDIGTDFHAIERQLREAPELVSRLGAPTVTVARRSDTNPANLMAYLFKNAAVAKRRVPSKQTLSGLALADCELRPASAVRQHEILSGIYLSELIFAGGEGSRFKEYLEQEIERRAPPRNGEQSPESGLRFWTCIRRKSGRDIHYYPVAVDRSDVLPSDCPIALTATRFYQPRGPPV